MCATELSTIPVVANPYNKKQEWTQKANNTC